MYTSIAIGCLLLASAAVGFAQFTLTSSVLDGSGAVASGGSYTNSSAAGQPGGIAESSGGEWIHQAGFLQTFFLKPGLDTDGDGLADEADRDNDADGLADASESTGATFSPATPTLINVADTDSDGMPDGDEAVAGTDPTDPVARLELVRIARGAHADVSWRARSNKTYRVLYAASPAQPLTNELALVTAGGPSSPPWHALTNTVTDAGASASRVYAVEVQP